MEKEVPVIGLSINEQIGQRTVVMQTHIASDCSDDEINALADRLFKVADRQKLYYETRESLYRLRTDLENHEVNLDTLKKDLVRVDTEMHTQFEESNRKGTFKMTQAQRQQRANVTKNIESFEFNIGRLKTAIEQQEKMLEGIGKA